MRSKRSFTPQQRLAIVLEGLRGDSTVADVCRRHEITPTLFYHWRQLLLHNADRVFGRQPEPDRRREAELLRANSQLREVVGEITAENLELKKTLGTSKTTPAFPRSSGR
jgi:transposase-like protein